jgi:eukaryotic-like serine/threonine-protein kinase
MSSSNPIKVKWPNPGDVITTQGGIEYIIGNLINNTGTFGLLYEGQDSFGNPVAIKILKPAKRKFIDVQKQWKSETDILDLVRHPNVVFIHGAFICDNLFYIVFERAWGNLFELISQVGPLHELEVREIARQLLFALYYIHNDQILHKDLTIYNILYFDPVNSGHGLYKVSDFGISEEFVDRSSSTNHVVHRLFKPPELIKFKYTTFQSDLYHLGLVLYYTLTGEFPYDIKLPQIELEESILSGIPRKKAEQLSTPFGDFISILLRRRQEFRFKTEIEAWNYLKDI